MRKKEAALLGIMAVVIAIVGFFTLYPPKTNKSNPTEIKTNNTPTTQAPAQETKIKHIGVNLDYYDPTTNTAGDFDFTPRELHDNLLFMNYGHTIPASPDYPEKRNPQPTFILPPDTDVHSLVDGTVIDTPQLYSGDYSVMVQGESSDLIFETEHVIDVKVKPGDNVKAGEVIAKISPHDSRYNDGFGLVEIGVLKGGNMPRHLCPFDYLDDSIKEDTLNKITALQQEWETYKNDPSLYDESEIVIPGCYTRDEIEG